jgi:ABC-type uncharacterized transport system ATPase component
VDARTHPHPYTTMKDNLKETEEALIDEALKKIYAVSGDPKQKISLILTGTEEENQIILDAMKEYYYEHLSNRMD